MTIPTILCTQNPGKLNELIGLFPSLTLSIMDQDAFVPEETGTTLIENALIKARHGHSLHPDTWIIADDSGIEVDWLDGAPGVYSAHYAGEHGDHAANIALLLKNMESAHKIMDRTARFACVLVAIAPDGTKLEARGTVEGTITTRSFGVGGFGYDPVFVPTGHTQTFGQLPLAVKQTLSHRARAAAKLHEMILAH